MNIHNIEYLKILLQLVIESSLFDMRENKMKRWTCDTVFISSWVETFPETGTNRQIAERFWLTTLPMRERLIAMT